MVREPESEQGAASAPPAAPGGAISVIGTYGAFRVLLVLIAVWTFFAGFSLLVRGFGALSFGGGDSATERVLGAYLLILVPVYVLLAWRRDELRLLLWLPYAAQLAVILPTLIDLTITRDRDPEDGALLLTISLIFLVLLVYFWLNSHPLEFFSPAQPAEDEEADDEEWPDEPQDDDGPGSLGTSPAERRPPAL